MWKVQREDDDEFVVLLVSGRTEREHLVELRELFASEAGNRNFALDLRELELADQDVVGFLSCCEAGGAQLRNCPPDIHERISRKRD
jgi:hypothetical protein